MPFDFWAVSDIWGTSDQGLSHVWCFSKFSKEKHSSPGSYGKHYNKGPNLNQAWELLEIHMEKQKQWWTMVTNQSWVNSAKQTKKHLV